MNLVCDLLSVNVTSLHSPVVEHYDLCREGHSFDSRQGIRFCFCSPILVTSGITIFKIHFLNLLIYMYV